MGSRRKARECALQMLFAIDVTEMSPDSLVRLYWSDLSDTNEDEETIEFASKLVKGTRAHLSVVDERIKSRAEHWRISRMAIVDRNILRLAVYEFLFDKTPHTVVINEGLEIARRFSTYEATQFINGILDAIKNDLNRQDENNNENADEITAPTAPTNDKQHSVSAS